MAYPELESHVTMGSEDHKQWEAVWTGTAEKHINTERRLYKKG